MATGDIKVFDYVYNGLTLQVTAIDNGNGTTDFQIKCLSGSADVNALWWADGTLDGSSPILAKADNSLNMNGTGVDWDGYAKLSSTGLGSLGWDKITALTAGETYYANDLSVSWSSITTLGVRATSTSTTDGSIKGVDSSAVVQLLPTVSVSDAATVTEGGTAHFTVTLSSAYAYDIKVFYQTNDGTANAGPDYTGANSFVIIPAGQTSATIDVGTINDATFELTETFTLGISAVADLPDALGGDVALTATDASGAGKITDDEAVPTVSISDGTPLPQTEGAGAKVSFTVSLTGPADKDVTVTYSTVNGSAVAGSDFTGQTAQTVTIPAGQTTATIIVDVLNDQVFELEESFSVHVDGAVYDAGTANLALTATDASGAGKITDDEAVPTVSISDGTPLPQTEGAGAKVSFTVSLTGPADKDVTVTYSTVNGSAVAGSDFTGQTSQTVTILAGQTTATIVIDVLDDSVFELEESFSVHVDSAVYGVGTANLALDVIDASGAGTIADDDPKPSFAIGDMTVSEAAGTITFTVTKSGATAVASSVGYTVNPGTAGTPGDYTGTLSGTLNFAPNETTKTITLSVVNDGTFELTESFTVDLANAVNATISDAQAVGTITDDEAAPTVSISDGTPLPQTEGAGAQISFTVSLTGPADKDVTVTYSTVNGSAVAGSDFTGQTAQTVTIPAGQTTATIIVDVLDDAVFELAESFSVHVDSAVYDAGGANLALTATDASGTGTIADNDPKPSFAIGDMTVSEAAGTITFTVTKSGATAVASSVGYTVNPGTAGTPGDYTGTLSGTLNFAANETTKTITLNVVNDGTFELTESFTVDLANAVNATIADAQAVGTITDNDPSGPVFGPTLSGAGLPTTYAGADPNDQDSDTGTATTNDYTATVGNDVKVGTTGADTISGGNGTDTLYGGAGGDTLSGGNQDDLIYGQPGSDTLDGGSQNDTIYGGSGDDIITGGSQNDILYGGSGNDNINGEGGIDLIIGGYGADTLTGGTEADTFQYLSTLDTNDTINGFLVGTDKIDLSAIDAIVGGADNAFTWAGQTPTNTAQVAANSVSWYTTGGNVIVLADTDGNTSTAELQITLLGINSITQASFVL